MSNADSSERFFWIRPKDPENTRRERLAWLKEHIALRLEAAKRVATRDKQVTLRDCFHVMELAAKANAMLEKRVRVEAQSGPSEVDWATPGGWQDRSS